MVPNVITYNSLTSACEKGKQPERALKLSEAMQRQGPPFPPRPWLPDLLGGRDSGAPRPGLPLPAFLHFPFPGLTFLVLCISWPHFAPLPGPPGLHLASQNRPQDLPKTVPGSVLKAMPKS